MHIKETTDGWTKKTKDTHNCQKEENNGKLPLKCLLSDKKVFEKETEMMNFMKQSPNLTVLEYYNSQLNKREGEFIFSKAKIEKWILQVKATLFPKQPEIAFSGKEKKSI